MDAGLKYIKHSDTGLLRLIEQEPRLLRLPLVRCGKLLSAGPDEMAWRAMMAAPGR